MIVKARQRFKQDLQRYHARMGGHPGVLKNIKGILLRDSIWCIWRYRYGQYLALEAPTPVRILAYLPFKVIARILDILFSSRLSVRADIGPGLYIHHAGGIRINSCVRIGCNCSLNHNVTIGNAGGGREGAPTLGDRVWVGPNATVVGNITVGSDAVICANSLVISNVPDKAVVIGVSAKIISYAGSSKLNRFFYND